MLDTDHNERVEADIKYLQQKGNRTHYKVSKPNKDLAQFKIFHQNIRGIAKKTGELVSHLYPDYPHVLCLTEHHLKDLQLRKTHIENYKLGAHYCRQTREKGGVAIFVHNTLEFTNIDISQHCKEQEIEICSLKLIYGTMSIFLLSVYRPPSSNFDNFLLKIDTIFQSL
jgi:exonuclease III